MKRSLFLNALAAFVIVGLATAALLFVRYDGNITGFFSIGDGLPQSPYLDTKMALIHRGSLGYDGQMFLSVALDPSIRNKGTLAALDNPQYRYRRIGYPLLGYVLGLGRQNLIPYTLVCINVLSVVGIVLLGTAYLYSRETNLKTRLIPLLMLAAPGIWISLFLSTADLFGILLLIAGLLALREGNNIRAAAFFCGACLTREVYLVSLISLGAWFFAQKKWRSACWLAVAGIPFLLWNVYVRSVVSGGSSGLTKAFGVPLSGILVSIEAIIKLEWTKANIFEAYCFFLLLLAPALIIADVLLSRSRQDLVNIGALPHILLLTLSRPHILDYHGGYLRVFIGLSLAPSLTLRNGVLLRTKLTFLIMNCVGSAAYVVNMIVS